MAEVTDERETRFLEYRNIFIGCVKNAQLCIELSQTVLRDEGEHIKRLYDIDPRKASEKLADAIIKSQDLGKWTELQRALTRSGFPYLIELLSGKKAHSEEEKRIIDLFASKLLDHINPTEIISQLLADDVITESDKQEILTRYDTKGSMAATILLLDNVQIHLPPKEWYRKFLTALLHNGHDDLVDEIDPDFKNRQRKACPGSDTDDTCNKAPMEVETNTPCWSSDNSLDHLSLTEEAVLSDDYQPSTSMDYMSTAPCTIGNVNVETGFQSRKRPGEGPESQRSQTNAKEESPHFDTAVKSEYDEPPAKFARVERMETGDVENAARDDSDCSDYGDEENDDVIDNVVDDSRKFKIRKFQQELSEKAIRGENTIISCETGTGKTYVAIHIIREHLKHRQNEGPKKVAFIAKTNVLVAQQKQRLEKFLPEYKVESLTREDEEALHMGSQLQYFDIFCLTPQILVNNLRGAESLTSLCQFSLLVFDECHHTMKDDPYNILMRHYLMEKSDCPSRLPNLPQILGLTASVGVGNGKSCSDAVDHILRLCANLDVRHISTVEREREEVERYISRPENVTIAMKTGNNTGGKDFLLLAINKTEKNLFVFLSTEPNVIDDWAKLPKEKGSQGYMTWLLSFEMSVINKVKNTTKSRNIVCCILHLYVYSAAMEVDYLLSLEEVVKYMDAQFQEENDRQEIMNDVEKKLLRRFTEVKAKLIEISRSEENPNLRQIQDILKTRFEEKGAESRGLIFVKARATCKALASWLNGNLANEGICVRPLYGKDKRGDEKGMSEEEQQKTLDQFDKGTLNVLVVTSVGEEGLDIQACDFTLSYNYVKNEISTIQMAGRIRRTSGGVNIVFGNDKVIRKERLNVHKVQMMYNAMEVFKKMNKRARDNQIHQIQQQEVKTERLRRRTEELRASSTDNSGNFELMCRWCPAVACINRDIRLLDSKRIVFNRDFESRINLRDPTLPDEIIDGYTLTQLIHCQGCQRYWGKVFQKHQVPCYVLQLKSFKVTNLTTRDVKLYKKWNKVPFKPEQIEFEEICKQHLQIRV